MNIAKKVTIVAYQNPQPNQALEIFNPLQTFGEFFFDGEKVYVNTKFEATANTADPYAELPDWYEAGLQISSELAKYKIQEYSIEFELGKEFKIDFVSGLYQGVWEYDEGMKSDWKLQVEAGFDKLTQQKIQTLAQGTYFCRNFVMLPNQFEPVSLAKKISKEFDNTIANIEIMDCEEMIEQKLLACVAVNNGSKKEPQFITITIPATIKSEQNLVVVGKCLYDVGGLALKDAPGQREMYIDKGGAATALGLAVYFAQFPLPDKNLVFLIPAVRNEVSDTSYTNGSVIPVGLCYPDLGKNVEIGNTDAEGRLTLADAVAWGQVKYKAKQIITLATLTGASLRAHGNGVASIFYNRNDTKDKIMSSFVQHQEQAEFFPYRVRYVGLLKPDNGVAALSNISSFGQIAGHHTAAEFVRKFIADDVDLTHVDFAGPVIDKKGVATGYGVRSLVGFLEG